MKTTAKISLRVIGAIATIASLFGIWYNGYTLVAAFSGTFADEQRSGDMPYFYQAFYLMSAICIICYVLLGFFGFQFLRGESVNLQRFTALMIFEVGFFFGISVLWLVPSIGMSVGAATGISLGGMMLQFFILFPLWAPLLAYWARRLSVVERAQD